ncbi:hypothetical protein D6D54_08470 [Spiroplasma poulsonii]|uniref:Uncharacterized protein n=1 Tax=Spiroplasma poulsonii TaxID=2138 RepID=A0A3S0TWL8_9MOLU|nr:hypothetical protein [Spiroplasma poulsonii]RUP75526.1 hypothetical protein D6D54_08470 [Spiroplasma poulsonii]
MRFVMCYKIADCWKTIKDDNNNFIIEKVLNNRKTYLKIARLKCNLKIIDNWFYFVEKYKTKEIEPILDKND